METMKPLLRWIAIGIAACAAVYAYLAPHRSDSGSVPDDSPPPPLAAATVAPVAPISSPSPGTIAVYVCGAIRKSGVFRLAPGSRVVDAVNEAGGLGSDADPEALNLAEPLTDGMKVDVPKKGAHPQDYGSADLGAVDPRDRPSRTAHSSRHHSTGRGGSHKLQPGQMLDINTATESELTQLPGVGPSLARRIVEYREANGPFVTVDDLQNVSGVGPSKFAKMEAFIHV